MTLSAPQRAALSAASSAKAPEPRTTTLFPAMAGAPTARGDGDGGGGGGGDGDEEEGGGEGALPLLSVSFHSSSSCLQALQTTPWKRAVEGSPLSSGVIALPRVPVATITVAARSLLLSTALFSLPSTAPPPPPSIPCARSLSSRSLTAAPASSS